MARRRPQAMTFAQLLREPTWSETDAAHRGEHAVRPGGVNPAGEFFDPFGKQVVRRKAEITPKDAQRAVDAGALVVAEGCGCGGGPGGCTPVWLDAQDLNELRGGPAPTFTRKYGSPTWLELWANDEREVVFAHGDVRWGNQTLG